MSRYTTALNLYLDGYERVANAFKNSMKQGSGHARQKSLVIAPGGRVIYFLRGEPIPAALQAGHIGHFTFDCPTEVIEDALICHMRQRAA